MTDDNDGLAQQAIDQIFGYACLSDNGDLVNQLLTTYHCSETITGQLLAQALDTKNPSLLSLVTRLPIPPNQLVIESPRIWKLIAHREYPVLIILSKWEFRFDQLAPWREVDITSSIRDLVYNKLNLLAKQNLSLESLINLLPLAVALDRVEIVHWILSQITVDQINHQRPYFIEHATLARIRLLAEAVDNSVVIGLLRVFH